MELRRRQGKGKDTAGNPEQRAGTNDVPASDSTSDHPQVIDRDIPSNSDAADAVVGAAVRGGSLLMLLALLQRASTFFLNVLLQRAMLSGTSTGDPSAADTPGHKTRETSALEEYGAAAITLELISSTALFLAREPFRVALARSRGSAKVGQCMKGEEAAMEREQREAYRRRFVNTAWLSAPVGLAFAALVRATYPWLIRNDDFDGVEENRQAATLVCVAAAVELMCEPLALIFQHRLLIDVRVRAEASAVLVLGVSRYLLVTRAGMGVLSFGYAQLLHSATLASAYLLFTSKDIARAQVALLDVSTTKGPPEDVDVARQNLLTGDRQGFARVGGWLPGRPSPSTVDSNGEVFGNKWVDDDKLKLAGVLAGQSLLKHILTEGDKIVLARASSLERGCGGGDGGAGHGGSLYEQGVYAIASGYGSLAARLLFQPLEEAARLMFSRLGAEEGSTNAREATETPETVTRTSGSRLGRATNPGRDGDCGGGGGEGQRLREKMATLLATLLKLVLTAGLVFVCFGFYYTETLLRLLLAGRGGKGGGAYSAVSEVARVLSWYCVYVLFLAANGMCEAFACAVARGGQLTGMGAGLVVSFATFWALVGPLTGRFGTRGLVMANAAGMACRVLCSAVFIRRFFLQQINAAGGRSSSGRSSVAAAAASPPRGGRAKKTNLWRGVVIGAIPHPAVVTAMAVSSAVAHASSPAQAVAVGDGSGSMSWDAAAAAKHVGVGAVCFGLTAVVFARFERKFLREVGSLWAARKPSRELGKGDAMLSVPVSGADGDVVGEPVDGGHTKAD